MHLTPKVCCDWSFRTPKTVWAIARQGRLAFGWPRRPGQPVHFQNVPGRARAEPSERFWWLRHLPMVSPHTIKPSLYRNLPYDALCGFHGVTQMPSMPNVLLVDRSFPAESAGETACTETLSKPPNRIKQSQCFL